jgi:outer membrane protein assembly factor BamB
MIYGSIWNAPTLDSRGTLCTGSTVGHVFGIDTRDGELLFDYDAGSSVWTAPTIRPDGTLLVGTFKGQLILFAAA